MQADYRLFKLYLMSLIWRMGITKLTAFESVKLGRKHEERLRSALINEDPLTTHDYPVILCAVTIQKNWLPDWIVPPHAGYFGMHTYAGIIGGFLHSFFVGSHPVHRNLQPLTLQEDGTIFMPSRNIREIPFLLKAMEEIQTARMKPGARLVG